MKFRFIFLTIPLFILISCDCMQYASGTIIDKRTKRPIQAATITKVGKIYDKDISDSTGKFEIQSISGGLKCPPMNISVEKEGYQKKIVIGGGLIELEKVLTVNYSESILIDSLSKLIIGNWALRFTISNSTTNSDTTKPTYRLWESENSIAHTNLIFDSTLHFTIDQDCMKCPMIHYEGITELKRTDYQGNIPYQITFIDNRQKINKKRGYYLTKDFSGYLTHIDKNSLSILNEKNETWVYWKIK